MADIRKSRFGKDRLACGEVMEENVVVQVIEDFIVNWGFFHLSIICFALEGKKMFSPFPKHTYALLCLVSWLEFLVKSESDPEMQDGI